MEITVTLSANAGVSICCGGYNIWVDALHTNKVQGFSAVNALLQGKLLNRDAFGEPDFICYTHCHGDHFSKELTLTAKELWPKAKLLLPEKVIPGQVLISGERFDYTDGDLTLCFYRLPHEGALYTHTIHYGIMITISGKHVLIPGDCQTASPVLAKVIGDANVDLALLDFPWMTLGRGRTFVKDVMKPSHIGLYHLPFSQDDCFGYRRAAEQAVSKEKQFDIQILYEPLQQVTIDI